MNQGWKSLTRTVGAAAPLAALLMFPEALVAQSLQIISPVNGAVVYSGQAMTVTVSADPTAFQSVTIFMPDPEQTTVLSGPPYQITVTIPTGSPSGRNKAISAMGTPTSGGAPIFYSISVDIERPDSPTQLTLGLQTVSFGYVGEQTPLGVTGAFADGSLIGLEDSTYTAYVSDTPSVAAVDPRGMLTAIAPGTASITITYSPPTGGSISALVPVTVPQPIIVLPLISSLFTSQSEPMAVTLAINPDLDQSVTWSISPQLGSIDNTGLYTAPSFVSSWQGVTVTATSVADPSKSSSAQIWVFPSVSVQMSPSAATLSAGQPQTFNTKVLSGGSDVTWTVDPAGLGTFQPFTDTDPTTYQPFSGAYYYAPDPITSPQTVVLTATSVYDNSKMTSARVTLVPSAAVSVRSG